MDDLLRLLNIERITTVGLLLTFIAGLRFEWWVMGGEHRRLRREHADLLGRFFQIAADAELAVVELENQKKRRRRR